MSRRSDQNEYGNLLLLRRRVESSPRKAEPCPTRKKPNAPHPNASAKHAKKASCRVRSEEHTSELQSLMRISYAVFCLKKKTKHNVTYRKTNKNTKHRQNTN